MKKNILFEQCLAKVPQKTKIEVGLNMDIANKISRILKERNLRQKDFAAMMGKKESEISRWLSGTQGFTTASIAKITEVLGEQIIQIVP